jgi:hypothetical protein
MTDFNRAPENSITEKCHSERPRKIVRSSRTIDHQSSSSGANSALIYLAAANLFEACRGENCATLRGQGRKRVRSTRGAIRVSAAAPFSPIFEFAPMGKIRRRPRIDFYFSPDAMYRRSKSVDHPFGDVTCGRSQVRVENERESAAASATYTAALIGWGIFLGPRV